MTLYRAAAIALAFTIANFAWEFIMGDHMWMEAAKISYFQLMTLLYCVWDTREERRARG